MEGWMGAWAGEWMDGWEVEWMNRKKEGGKKGHEAFDFRSCLLPKLTFPFRESHYNSRNQVFDF